MLTAMTAPLPPKLVPGDVVCQVASSHPLARRRLGEVVRDDGEFACVQWEDEEEAQLVPRRILARRALPHAAA
jgi:hypothetical protein